MKYTNDRVYTAEDIEEKDCFNRNMDMAVWCLNMRDKYGIKTVVETGTYLSRTTKFLSEAFEKVYTIDIMEEFVDQAREKFAGKNVECLCGNSLEVIEPVCQMIDKDEMVLFLLDAHGNYLGDLISLGLRQDSGESTAYYSDEFDINQCPTKQEIEVISRHFKDRCVIMVDDIFNPEDSEVHYINFGGVKFDYNYLKDSLDKCYSSPHKHSFVRETSLGWPKARLLIEPAQ